MGSGHLMAAALDLADNWLREADLASELTCARSDSDERRRRSTASVSGSCREGVAWDYGLPPRRAGGQPSYVHESALMIDYRESAPGLPCCGHTGAEPDLSIE